MAIKLRAGLTHWARFQTIVKALGRLGFCSTLRELGWFTESVEGTQGANHAEALRIACEQLGPTFIKLGQLLSTRPDLLPEAWVLELLKLTDRVAPLPTPDILAALDHELGHPWQESFEWIDTQALAAASMSQVHRARLKESGREVVIKIQKPGIEKLIQSDIQILYFIARGLEKLREEFHLMNLTSVVREFQRSIHEELDFTLEAKNLELFRSQIAERERLVIPEVVWEATNKRVLTMSWEEGISLAQMTTPPSADFRPLVEDLVTFFFESMLIHGAFHSDIHTGNVLFRDAIQGRPSQLVILDFGMVGRLSNDLRSKLSRLFLAIVSKDFESLARVYQDVGEFAGAFSLRDFERDLSDLLAPHLDRPLREVPIGQLMLDSTKVARRYRVRVPRDMIMVFRSLMTLEAIGRKLDPDFEFISYGKKFGTTLMRHRFSADEMIREVSRTLDGFRAVSQDVPIYVRQILRVLEEEQRNPPILKLQKTVVALWTTTIILTALIAILFLLLS